VKIAVTGVGGGVGQSICKALSISSLETEVYPVDVQPLSAGLYRGKEGLVLPKGEEQGSMEIWRKEFTKRGIGIVFPGSDYDVVSLAHVRDEWTASGGPRILCSDLELVRDCRDKARTYELLTRNGIDAPRCIWGKSEDETLEWAEKQGYPLILKPRDGSASRNVMLVKDSEELRFYLRRVPNAIVQEYLNVGGRSEEFTCAVFVDKSGEVTGTFMARRTLSGGTTFRAEVGYWPELQPFLVNLGKKLQPRGPINVQLRMTDRGPVPFELNIRCSGTTAIRAYYGYNEPEMWIRNFVLGEKVSQPERRTGFALRYWNEVFVPDVTAMDLDGTSITRRGEILPWP
jgi:carbamoyl-phosphate synthase large subunit